MNNEEELKIKEFWDKCANDKESFDRMFRELYVTIAINEIFGPPLKFEENDD